MAKKRKPFDPHAVTSAKRIGVGKGSGRRDAEVDEEEIGTNWCLATGHKPNPHIRTLCRNCGTTLSPEESAP